MAGAAKLVVCSHCAERLHIAADFTGTQFRCVKCGELTTIQRGTALADNTKALAEWWERLPTRGRFAVALTPLLVIAVIMAVAESHPFRDDRSYEYGRESAPAARAFYATLLQVGGAASDEKRRDSCYRMVNLNKPEGIVFDDAMDGCLNNF